MTATQSQIMDALDYLDDMTGKRVLDIPGGRSPVMFLSKFEDVIRTILQSALDSDEIVSLVEQIDMDFDTLKDCIPNKNDRDVFFKPIQSRIKELSSLLGGKNGTSA